MRRVPDQTHPLVQPTSKPCGLIVDPSASHLEALSLLLEHSPRPGVPETEIEGSESPCGSFRFSQVFRWRSGWVSMTTHKVRLLVSLRAAQEMDPFGETQHCLPSPRAIPWKLGSIHRDPSGSFHSLRERRSRQLSIGVLLRSICLNWSEFGSNQLPVNSPPICPKILRITLLAGMPVLQYGFTPRGR